MIQTLFQTQGSEADRRPEWFNSPVKYYKGTLSDAEGVNENETTPKSNLV